MMTLSIVLVVLAGAALGLAVWLMIRHWLAPLLIRELAAARCARDAEELVWARGPKVAREEIEAMHVGTIAQFDRDQMARLDGLRDDPVALARWLTRVAR